jgi:hypothetical protein
VPSLYKAKVRSELAHTFLDFFRLSFIVLDIVDLQQVRALARQANPLYFSLLPALTF